MSIFYQKRPPKPVALDIAMKCAGDFNCSLYNIILQLYNYPAVFGDIQGKKLSKNLYKFYQN
ncbi:MAG TPA: hypothetical protein DCY88_22660 [Cyanobacteria bacterium UBA11372]|nr:hypothetical protein [Cyanobacteria bacterium UBA11372]